MRKHWLLFTPVWFLAVSIVAAQNSGSYSTAGFDNARTNLNTGLQSVKPPLRLFETIDLSGLGDASSMVTFDGYYLAGQAGPQMSYRLLDPLGNPVWSVGFNGSGERLNYVPAYAQGVVILGGDGTSDIRAIDVADGSELWRKKVGNTGGRHPIVTGNLAVFAGENRVEAVQARTGLVFWQIPVTTAAAPLAAFGTRVYFLEHANTLRAVDVRTGTTAWWINGVAGDGGSVVASEKLVYVSNPENSTVRAFMTRSGETAFAREFPDARISPSCGLALGFGRLLVFQEDDGAGQAAIIALDQYSGEPVWEIREETPGLSSAFLANDILYYYHEGSGRIRARDIASGALLWSLPHLGVRSMAAADLTFLQADTTVQTASTAALQVSEPASRHEALLVLLPDSLEVYCSAQELELAQVASGGGQSNMIIVSNVSPEEAEVTLEFFDDDGRPLSLPVELPQGGNPSLAQRAHSLAVPMDFSVAPVATTKVPPNSSTEILVLSQDLGVSVGWVRVTSDKLVRASSIFQFWRDGRVTNEAGVGDSPPAGSGNVFVKVGDGFDTGLAFANPNEEPAVVTLHLLGAEGLPIDTVTFTLDPLGHRARFVSEIFDGWTGDGFRGTVAFECDLPITVVALRTQDGLQISSYPIGQVIR